MFNLIILDCITVVHVVPSLIPGYPFRFHIIISLQREKAGGSTYHCIIFQKR